MNIQEAVTTGARIRRTNWLTGIFIWIRFAGTCQAQMLYAENANGAAPWGVWSPSVQDLAADNWELAAE